MGLFATPPRAAPRTLRALAWLLRYPDHEVRAHLLLLREALHHWRCSQLYLLPTRLHTKTIGH